MIRILIADDHPVVRQGLRQVLEDEADLQVTAEAGDAAEVHARLEEGDYDVVVLDLSMPEVHGVSLVQEVHERRPDLRILVLSIHPEDQYALRCLKAGARGYVHKGSAAEELVGAIRMVVGGRRYLSEAFAESLLREAQPEGRAPHERLSTREYQVLTGIAGGRSVTQIAAGIGVSVKTVSTYRTRMLEKLGIASNAEATRYVLEHRLLEDG